MGSLGTFRALEHAATALGDELPAHAAGHVAARLVNLSWTLTASQRLELAELIDDLAHILHESRST